MQKLNEIKINIQDSTTIKGIVNFNVKELTINLSPSNNEKFGRLVSKNFASDAVQSFEKFRDGLHNSQLNNIRRINFSKDLIHLILAQENCEGLSVFFCLPPSQEVIDGGKPITIDELEISRKKVSVLLIGIKGDGTPLTILDSSKQDGDDDTSIMSEVGGHDNPFIDILTDIQYFDV
jgi:hypothetical protein